MDDSPGSSGKVPSIWGTFLTCGVLVLIPVLMVVYYIFGESWRNSYLARDFGGPDLIKLGESYQAPPPKLKLTEHDMTVPVAALPPRKGKVLILYRPLGADIVPEIHPDHFKLPATLRAAKPAEVGTLVFVNRTDRVVGFYAKGGQAKNVNTAVDGAHQAIDIVSVYTGKPMKLAGTLCIKGKVKQTLTREDSHYNPEPNLKAMVESMKEE